MRHGIQVRSDEHGLGRPVRAGKRHEESADGVDCDLQAQAFGRPAHNRMGRAFSAAIARPRHPWRIERGLAQGGEERLRQLAAHIHRISPGHACRGSLARAGPTGRGQAGVRQHQAPLGQSLAGTHRPHTAYNSAGHLGRRSDSTDAMHRINCENFLLSVPLGCWYGARIGTPPIPGIGRVLLHWITERA